MAWSTRPSSTACGVALTTAPHWRGRLRVTWLRRRSIPSRWCGRARSSARSTARSSWCCDPPETVQAGRWSAVLFTLELLPEALRRAHPDLSLIEARALLLTGHPQQAYQAAEAALHHGGRSGDVSVQIRALIELAIITFTSDMAAAEDWLSAADHLLRNHDLPPDRRRLFEGTVQGVRGICATLRGEVAYARECFENGERLLSLLGPSRDLALVQQNFGSFCNRTGDYVTAQEALASAASHWRLMGDRNGLATTQTILGELHLRLGNLDAGGAALNDALTAATSVGALRQEAYATAALGQWHRASGRIIDAVAAFDAGLKLAEDIVERELLADTLVWRAEVALLQDDLPTARELLARAQAEASGWARTPAWRVSIGRSGGSTWWMARVRGQSTTSRPRCVAPGDSWGPDQRAETLYWLGTACLNLQRAQQALGYLEQAVAIAEQANLPALLAGPAAEDPRLLAAGRKLGLSPILLAEVERMSATRRPWTGIPSPAPISVIAENELPRLEAQLFGSFVLHRDGQHVQKVTRKVDRARELLALLILNPKGLPDEAIAEHMWPEMPRERALHNLQMAAYSLREDLGSKAAIRYGAHTYQLNPQLELIADVRAFDAALARARVVPPATRSLRRSPGQSSCIADRCSRTPHGTGSSQCGSTISRATSRPRFSSPTSWRSPIRSAPTVSPKRCWRSPRIRRWPTSA